jgi:hypothetical protein
MVSHICRETLKELVETIALSDWKEVLGILCSYAKTNEVPGTIESLTIFFI